MKDNEKELGRKWRWGRRSRSLLQPELFASVQVEASYSLLLSCVQWRCSSSMTWSDEDQTEQKKHLLPQDEVLKP